MLLTTDGPTGLARFASRDLGPAHLRVTAEVVEQEGGAGVVSAYRASLAA